MSRQSSKVDRVDAGRSALAISSSLVSASNAATTPLMIEPRSVNESFDTCQPMFESQSVPT